MDLKKIIPVVVVILFAVVVVIFSGAFTSVTAERTAVINVAGDSSALLQIVATETANGQYVNVDDDGAIYLDFTDVAAEGVNVDAETTFQDVFTITNNGTQAVTVVLTKAGETAGRVDFGEIEDGVTLSVGDAYTVSFSINTYDLSEEDNLLSSITLTATV